MALFTMIWQWIVWLFNTLLPFKEGRSLAPIVVWVIWIILDATMLVVLWFLNDWSGIGTGGAVPCPSGMPGRCGASICRSSASSLFSWESFCTGSICYGSRSRMNRYIRTLMKRGGR